MDASSGGLREGSGGPFSGDAHIPGVGEVFREVAAGLGT